MQFKKRNELGDLLLDLMKYQIKEIRTARKNKDENCHNLALKYFKALDLYEELGIKKGILKLESEYHNAIGAK